MNKFLRLAGFIATGLFLKWPILILLALTRHYHIFNYIVVVYSASDSDQNDQASRKRFKFPIFFNQPIFSGFISDSPGGRGLVLSVPITVEQFLIDKNHLCEKVIKQLIRIGNIMGAKSIVAVGQLPSVLSRKGFMLNQPFVQGNKGTVFCIMATIDQALQMYELDINNTRIAVVGVGYCGKLLLNSLEEEGYCAIGIDVFPHSEAIILKDNIHHVLANSNIIVVLTPSGDDFVPYIKYLKNEAIIIDDTYPAISKPPFGRSFYRAVAGIKGTRIFPHFPGFKTDCIPGCVVEAIITAAIGDCSGISQREFNKIAKEMGFFAHLSSGLLQSIP